MDYGHDHPPAAEDDRRLLALSLVLILAFMVVEVVFAVVSSSLALLADTGHMLTDAAALALALLAAWAAKLPARGRWTFGFGRAEILAAQANGITLALIGVWILYGRAWWGCLDRRPGRHRGQSRRARTPLECPPGQPEHPRRLSPHRHRPGRVRRHGRRRRAHPPHRLGPLRPGRLTARRRPHVPGELYVAQGVGPHLPRGGAGVCSPCARRPSDRRTPRRGGGPRPPRLDGDEWLSGPLRPRARRAGRGLPPDPARVGEPIRERFGLDHTTLQVEHVGVQSGLEIARWACLDER